MAKTHIALLRGINVGGKNRLPMKDLTAMFVGAGCSNVRTYIQSGNVVFDAPARVASKIAAVVAAEIEKKFGFKTTLVIRSAEELEAASRHPFHAPGVSEDHLAVMFLADLPAPERVAALDPDRSPHDRFIVQGREIFGHYPNGQGQSKLTNAYFDSKLKTVSTGRNWRTVQTLLQMARGK